MGERGEDRQAFDAVIFDPLAVLKVFGQEMRAAELECGRQQQAIPPGIAETQVKRAGKGCFLRSERLGAEAAEAVNDCEDIRRVNVTSPPQQQARCFVQHLKIGAAGSMVRQRQQPLLRQWTFDEFSPIDRVEENVRVYEYPSAGHCARLP
jgi:hypothetical protein